MVDKKLKTGKKFSQLSYLLAAILLIILVNRLSGLAFFRLDLTAEKRYSLSVESREVLRNLNDIVFVRVYLDGDLPADLIRFRESIRESLQEFKAYAGPNLIYEFINVYEEDNEEELNEKMRELSGKGLNVTDVQLRDSKGGTQTKIIFPGALITYKEAEFPVNLLKNNPALPYQKNLENSIQSIEYEFIKAISSLTDESLRKIAFVEGQGELDFYETYDISAELSLFFQVDRGQINGDFNSIKDYEAIIIASPEQKYSEQDKFVLDQYLMQGGRILFFLEPVEANEDSLVNGQTFTYFNDPGIYDLLFKYGVRVEYNIVKDLQCNFKRIQTSINDQNPRTRIIPWWYSPLLSGSGDHFLTRGLNYIKSDYVSALDTTASGGKEKTVLLSTSDSSSIVSNPVYISLREMIEAPERNTFNDGRLPIAILVEGEFESFYKNYGIPSGVRGITEQDRKTRGNGIIMVTGDADMIRNPVSMQGGQWVPGVLGYDRNTRQTFGNKEFIMNVVNYMTGDQSLIRLRAKEFKLRLLDRAKLRNKNERLKWTLLNTVLPVLIVVLSGVIFSQFRKRKFQRADR